MSEHRGSTWLDLIGLGIASGLCIAAGIGGGYAIASATRTGPALTFVGLAAGIVAAVAVTYFRIKRNL